jgi:hypothetical protein
VSNERIYTVHLPAAFEEYFSDTGMAQGDDSATAANVAAYHAWKWAEKIKAGSGHSIRVAGTREALGEIRRVTQEFLDLCGPAFPSTHEERAAARVWIARISNALKDRDEEKC